jgi:hypothetical protein
MAACSLSIPGLSQPLRLLELRAIVENLIFCPSFLKSMQTKGKNLQLLSILEALSVAVRASSESAFALGS